MEFEGARKNNMEEKEEETVMDERIYVAVGRETAKNKSNLTWVIDNSPGNKICIVLVHRPAQMIPVLGTKFDAATVDEELVRAYRGKQKAKTEKILDDYLRICLHKGVQAEKLCVEMDSIEKGIVQMISENRVRKFVMGAAADKHYSTRMEDLRSKKAIFVCQHASATCHIQFICKGHHIHTREGRMDEVRALSSLLSDFQRLVVSSQSSKNSDMHSGISKGKSECEEEEEERTSRTSSCRSAGTLSYFGGSEASSTLTEEKSNYSVHSSPPSLPCSGMGFGMIKFLINSTKLWQRLAIQNHKQCECPPP
uniref:RING-type E3 ubiquitin transferase n=1 Tax=Noccaea caerulescens TaxID=107243 RepID=A0A1J3ERT0_NOCCA